MIELEITEVLVIAAVLLLALVMAFVFLRHRFIAGGAPMFLCGYRDDGGTTWHYGLARFDPTALVVYRAGGVSFHPRVVLGRAGLELLGSVEGRRGEVPVLVDEPVVVTWAHRGGGATHELALPRDVGTALRSWHEATPPGTPPLS